MPRQLLSAAIPLSGQDQGDIAVVRLHAAAERLEAAAEKVETGEAVAREAARGAAAHVQELFAATVRKWLPLLVMAGFVIFAIGLGVGFYAARSVDRVVCGPKAADGQVCWVQVRRWF